MSTNVATEKSHANGHLENLRIPQRIERLPMTSYQRLIGAVIIFCWFVDCFDLGVMGFALPSVSKHFDMSLVQMGLFISMNTFGMFFGALFAGTMSDRFGRKVILQNAMWLWGIAGLCCAFSWNIGSLFFFRFMWGLGLGGQLPVAHAMLPEFMPTKARGRYVATAEGILPVAFVFAGLMTAFVLPVLGWRYVFAISALLAVAAFLVRVLITESPRWLETTGRKEEAERVMLFIENQVQKRYGKPLPPVPEKVLVEKETGKQSIAKNLAELWSHDYYKRTLMLWIVWPACLFGYYGLTNWLAALLVGKGYAIIKSINFVTLITCGGIPGFLTAVYLIDKIGRKPIVAAFIAGTAVSSYLYGNAATLTYVYVWGFLMQFCVYGMWSSVYAYTPELYPTRMRGTGTGLSSTVGRIGAMLGPYAIGVMLSNPALGYSAVFNSTCIIFAVAAAAVLILGPETKNRILEDISH